MLHPKSLHAEKFFLLILTLLQKSVYAEKFSRQTAVTSKVPYRDKEFFCIDTNPSTKVYLHQAFSRIDTNQPQRQYLAL